MDPNNSEWLQKRLDKYRAERNDMCEAMEEPDYMDTGSPHELQGPSSPRGISPHEQQSPELPEGGPSASPPPRQLHGNATLLCSFTCGS